MLIDQLLLRQMMHGVPRLGAISPGMSLYLEIACFKQKKIHLIDIIEAGVLLNAK